MSKPGSESEPLMAGEFANDLDWIAFCYVADELSGDQLAQFEARLETDQAARDAVAEAMKISMAVYESGSSTVTPSVPGYSVSESANSTATNRVSQWMLALTAALLIGVGLAAWIANSNSGTSESVAEVNEEELAIAWADTFEEVEFKDSVDGLDEFASSEESVSDEGEWMYVAFTELELAGDEELTQ